MVNKIILGLDIDGVVYDYHRALYTFCQYELNYSGTYEKFWLDYIQNASKEKQDYLIGLPIPYETSVPSKEILEFLNFAKENCKDIYYLTHRPEDLERISKRYFKRYDLPYPENIFFTGDKATACRYFGVTHFLDDFVTHVKAVEGIADAYLMAKPWNREFQEDFKTVHSLREFQEKAFA